MKTNEFIELLKKEDPEGVCDITVGNEPVYWIERLPYYYDGRLQRVIREKGIPIYAGYPTDEKIKIHVDSIEEVLFDYPEFQLDTKGIEYKGEINKRYAEDIEKMRQEGRKLQAWKKESDECQAKGLPLPPIVVNEPTNNKPLTWKKKLGNWLKENGIIE